MKADNQQDPILQADPLGGGAQHHHQPGYASPASPRAATPQPARSLSPPVRVEVNTPTRPTQANPHQAVLESLLQSGLEPAEIEAEWQRYYQRLHDDDKHHLWQTLHGLPEFPDLPPTSEVVDKSPQADPAGASKPRQTIKHAQGNLEKLSRRFQRGWQQSWQIPDSIQGNRRQVIAYNVKTVVVAVVVGLGVYSAFHIGIWNEKYLQPYLRPQANAAQAQVIITPGAQLTDPEPRLYIPKLAIELNVDYEVQRRQPGEPASGLHARFQAALTDSVVHYPTSALPGQGHNAVIMGHSGGNIFSQGSPNYKFAFSRLKDLNRGDLLVLNYQRRQFVYKVYEKKIVLPSEVSVLRRAPRDHSLTLITCDPPGSNVRRLVVFAQQISPTPTGPTAQGQLIDLDQLGDEDAFLPGNTPSLLDSFRSPNY